MDEGISSQKEDGWTVSCYAALCGRCLWFCRAVRRRGSLFIRQDAARCFLHQLLYISPHRLLAKAWLWTTCSARPARQQRSLTGCTLSLTHLTNLHFQTPMNDGQTLANEQVGTKVGNSTVEQRESMKLAR